MSGLKATSDRDCWRKVKQSRTNRLLITAFIGALLLSGCETQTVKTQALTKTGELETALQRGVSTKSDVLLFLGEPDGAGAFGGFDNVRGPEHAAKGAAGAWYYEANKSSLGTGISLDMQVLLIFFEGEKYDGFYWFNVDEKGSVDFE